MKQNNNMGQCFNVQTTTLKNNCIAIYNYRDPTIKNILYKIKNDKDFIKSTGAKSIITQLLNQIQRLYGSVNQEDIEPESPNGVESVKKTLIINVPSTSYWMSKKSFDHMHILIKQIIKMYKTNTFNIINGTKDSKNAFKIIHLSHAIIPRVVKSSQKKLTKEQRIYQSNNAYKLSWSFKKLLQDIDCNIIILDDIHTTGSTIRSCKQTVDDYLNKIHKTHIRIMSLTIAYEP